MTLHRIETGAASVSLGALMNVLEALDLSLGQLEGPEDGGAEAGAAPQAETIVLAAYPLLRQLAWHVQGTGTLSAAEAAALYARQRQLISTLQQPAATNDVPACQGPQAAPAA